LYANKGQILSWFIDVNDYDDDGGGGEEPRKHIYVIGTAILNSLNIMINFNEDTSNYSDLRINNSTNDHLLNILMSVSTCTSESVHTIISRM
jgi:hypothetical protein